MKKQEGRAQARITIFGTQRELFCRVLWPENLNQAERKNFLTTLINELDRLMRESNASETDINKSG